MPCFADALMFTLIPRLIFFFSYYAIDISLIFTLPPPRHVYALRTPLPRLLFARAATRFDAYYAAIFSVACFFRLRAPLMLPPGIDFMLDAACFRCHGFHAAAAATLEFRRQHHYFFIVLLDVDFAPLRA